MCDPFYYEATFDPDRPKPQKYKPRCIRQNGVLTALHARKSHNYYKCAFSNVVGCKCCECKVRVCPDMEWEPWGTCDAATGMKSRSRGVHAKVFEGEPCPKATEHKNCWDSWVDLHPA
jgi:hypothetical protein